MSVRRLWLVRHARPLVDPGTCYGALDVPADPAATADCARQLADVLPPGMHARHSPLQRCELLAQALQALRPDLIPRSDARLVEMDFGAWEGCAWNAIARADIDAWTTRFAEHRPGGGEPLGAMLQRVAAALHGARTAPPGDVLWISHAGVARCVQWLLEAPGRHGALPRSDQWPHSAPAFGQWACYALD